MAVEFKVDDSEVQKILKGLEPKVAKQLMRKVLRPAMKTVADFAKSEAPVDTGELKKSIKVRAMKRSRKAFGVEITFDGEKMFHGDVKQAGWIEFGTKSQPPQPFIRPAYDTKGNEALQAALTQLKQLVEEQANK